MTLFLQLLLAHLLGDFALQPDRWAKDKAKRGASSRYLYLHMAVHTALLLAVLRFDLTYWKGLAIVIATHLMIDLAKILLNGKFNPALLFAADQLAHVAVIAAVAHSYEPIALGLGETSYQNLLLGAVALVMVTFVSSIVIRMLMDAWSSSNMELKGSLPNAGHWIGIMERLFVFTFIVTDHWEAIGFLLAAKSVFRFGDLSRAKDRQLTEYILIGTLLSFGLATAIGMGYVYLRQLVGG